MTTPSKTLRNLNRRRFLQSSAAVTAGLAAPAIVSRQALASSGEINIMMWSDYLPPSFVEAFEGSTGIKINFTGIGSNEEIINKLKATGGEGFDIVSPTVNRNLLWAELGLLQPFDMSKIAIEKVNPAMALGDAHWNFDGKGSHWVPHIWGTEGVAWRTDLFTPAGEFPSYYDIWDDANAGKTMGRGHSMLLGLGLGLERIGELEPGSMWAAYTTPEKMTEVWTKVVDHAIAKKGNIKLIWNDADTQKNGLLNEGVIVGQTWDGPPIALKTAGEPVMYRAPVEGAMAWVDGMALPTGAKNIEQVYAFIDACYNPEWAGTAIQTHGYNSPVLGADAFGGEIYAQNFADAYPGEALANLNAWPAEGPWYSEMRTEFTNKFLSA
ncbi:MULTISPECIES: substrate-binding domain-containing protein [Actibacterium]|uniref:Spermidine/putrescine transport system substrate-binding protein n=1 Tax=Actibacterium naphthalenivorans TaxID=1614693 RepID=A0A840C569_9RHOB|nr:MULTISPECIES: substrate-binding domain-containing protein [Actibacterium]ALG91765.1 spermidine/putrescine ABC transporter substrate-binding protein [Actibacterium sp. EMB200-NS6]MBB4020954.1 spermidine/putrescine transport system substrate-binding protein [Actibacterium naphthalenivorans]